MPSLSLQLQAGETLDQLSQAGLKIIQPRKGPRFNMDALLLADFSLQSGAGGRAIDLGSGSGVIALLLAASPRIKEVVGLELQAELAELAQRNVLLNKLEHKIKICRADWRRIKTVLKGEKFDLVVANPPYWRAGSGRINPQHKQAQARHELAGKLEDLIIACRYLVRPARGWVNLICPAQRLAELTLLLEKHRLQPKQLQFIHHDFTCPASLFMLRASLNGQPGLEVLPPRTVPK